MIGKEPESFLDRWRKSELAFLWLETQTSEVTDQAVSQQKQPVAASTVERIRTLKMIIESEVGSHTYY